MSHRVTWRQNPKIATLDRIMIQGPEPGKYIFHFTVSILSQSLREIVYFKVPYFNGANEQSRGNTNPLSRKRNARKLGVVKRNGVFSLKKRSYKMCHDDYARICHRRRPLIPPPGVEEGLGANRWAEM